LAIAFFFATACLGFSAWAFPNMSRLVTIPGAVITFGFAVYFLWPELNNFYESRPCTLITIVSAVFLAACVIGWNIWPRSDQADIEMARRWVQLSSEIVAELPTLRFQFQMIPMNPAEDWHKQWQDQVNRNMKDEQESLDRMSRLYLGRVREAQLELQKRGLFKPDTGWSTENGELMLDGPAINMFFWERWVNKLSAEGRHILTENGEK
jgi:hypothetical protein